MRSMETCVEPAGTTGAPTVSHPDFMECFFTGGNVIGD